MRAGDPAIVGSYGRELDAPTHSMLGLAALVAEMQAQGVEVPALFAGTGVQAAQLDDPQARMSHRQKIAIFRNVQQLATDPAVGLNAGARQRLSDFGVYGYALVSSATVGAAVAFGIKHVQLAGPVLSKSFRIEGDNGIFEGHDAIALGDLLPLVTEFWFSSVLALCQCILEAPFPSRQLLLPYPRPEHWQAYERRFDCPVAFDSGRLEWHFDAAVLALPCPSANAITASVCQSFCERVLEAPPGETDLSHDIRTACLNSSGHFPNADQMAAQLGLSLRTLHRRLAQDGLSYQGILDEVRRSLAIEFLRNTDLSVEQVADRVGFSEASNFRKAFKKWTGRAPGSYRGESFL